MINIKNVSKSYDGIKQAVDNLTLELRPGEIFGFLGPNGAGKTTTIKMIVGISKIDSGQIKVGNYDITAEPEEAKKHFGYIPDSPNMFLKLKGIEYLNFLAAIYRVDQVKAKNHIEKMARDLEIFNNLDQLIESYSHGMRQKLLIIGALLHNPDIWILDEPLTGLDPKSSFYLKELMHQHVAQGKTVFFSTHVLDVAEKLCDRIGIINRGKLIFVGTVDQLRKERTGSLEEIFLELVE